MTHDATHPLPALLADVSACPRHQPYRLIHKALRRLLTRALVEIGACDVRHPADRRKLAQAMELALSTCADHIAHENRYFHEPLRRRAPRATLAFDHDHEAQLQAIDALRARVARLESPDEDASALAYEIYLAFSEFVAENLQHMTEEETVLTQALWQHLADDEILDMENTLRASLSEQQSTAVLRWMAASLNNQELHGMLAGARCTAPAAAFERLLELVCGELSEERAARLSRELGVAEARRGEVA